MYEWSYVVSMGRNHVAAKPFGFTVSTIRRDCDVID